MQTVMQLAMHPTRLLGASFDKMMSILFEKKSNHSFIDSIIGVAQYSNRCTTTQSFIGI